MKNFIYIHVGCINDWQEIYRDIVSFVPENERQNIYSVVLGEPGNSISTLTNPIPLKNLTIDYAELATLQLMQNHARLLDTEEAAFYYLHTKGVTRKGDERAKVDSWRRFMCKMMFNNMDLNKNLLEEFDCLGSMLISNPLHYQGNFFVTKASHLRKLPEPRYDKKSRGWAESWICAQGGKYLTYNKQYQLQNLYQTFINQHSTHINYGHIERIKSDYGLFIDIYRY